MKKKLVLLTATAVTSSICVGVVAFSFNSENLLAKGDQLTSGIVLNDKSAVTSADEGYLHQIRVKNCVFDMVGWNSTGGALGSIKKDTYGDSFVYNGMIYNRSAINGFSQLTVKFSGGDLYYVFSDFLMENMDFNGSALTSESPVSVPNNEAYFIVYTTSTSAVNIDSVKVDFLCDHSIDEEMIFNQNSTMGGARSLASKTVLEDSYVTLTNNPTKYNNNYSVGQNPTSKLNYSWYRWNGRYFAYSGEIGTQFSFGTTIIGNISQMIGAHEQKEDNYFHYGVWPQFTFGDTLDERKANAEYEMIYIGNDNYEPLGKDHALRPSDPYVSQSYSGRFFTAYEGSEWHLWSNSRNAEYEEGGVVKSFSSKEAARAFVKSLPAEEQSDWRAYIYDSTFVDPDTTNAIGSSKTLREAYETYTLPYWFVRFDIYLAKNDIDEVVPYCDGYVNGFKIFSSEIFYEYDTVNNPGVHIHSLPMHVVNYGVDAEGNPASKYDGTFTYPRLIVE